MNNTYIQLENGNILDINEDIGFAVSYSLDDIKNFSKKNTSNSKTIILPSTDNNIKQFGMLGINLNETFFHFNPNFRTKAKLISDSEVIMNGYFQLKNITKTPMTDLQTAYHQYEIIFFENTIDFFIELGEKYLTDLSFSGENHEYSKQNIEDSWTHTYADTYTYPLMYKGSDVYSTRDFKPSFFNRAVFDKVIYNSSFTVGGSLLSDPIFNREIIPFVGEEPKIPDSEFTRRNFRAGMTGNTPTLSTTTYKGGISGTTVLQPTIQTALSAYTYFNDDSTGSNFDNDNHFDTLTSTYTVDRNGVYDLDGRLNFKVKFESKIEFTGLTSGATMSRIKITYPNHNYEAGTSVIITGSTGYDGTYSIAAVTANEIEIAKPFSGTSTGTLAVTSYQYGFGVSFIGNTYGNFAGNGYNASNSNYGGTYVVAVTMYKNGAYLQQFNTSGTYTFPRSTALTTNSTFNAANEWEVESNHQISILRPNIPLLSGDVITLKYQINKIGGSETNINKVMYVDGTTFSSAKSVPLRIKLESVTGFTVDNAFISSTSQFASMTDGDTVYVDNYLPKKIKLKDYINDIVRRYNVYITQDELDSKKLLFNSRDDFYAQGGVIDWTDKKDYSFQDKVEFLTDLTTKEVLFSYKNDSDDWNKYYTNNTISENDEKGQTYGQKRIEYDNEFRLKGTTTKIETIFSPTISVPNSINNRFIVPGIKTVDPKCNIRTLIWNGLKDPLNTSDDAGVYSWYLDHIDSGVTNRTYYLQYPQALMTDDAEYPGHDIKFGEVEEPFSTAQAISVDNNLYNKYWKNYLEEIATGKLVTSRFYLTSNDIANIKNKLNSKIFIKDSYFYISKIKDFDPTKKGQTTEVELLKINKGVPFVASSGTTTATLTPFEASRLVQPEIKDLTNTVLSRNVIVGGSNNFVGPNSDGAIVIGDNNIVGENFRGMVIGTGITTTEGGNGIYLENAIINSDGTISNASGETISNNFCASGLTASIINSCSNGNMTIGGGIGWSGYEYANVNTGDYSSVMLGGFNNTNSGSYGTSVIGGYGNVNSGSFGSSIIGGKYNSGTSTVSIVAGGFNNSVGGTASFIGGGGFNLASGKLATVVGGQYNSATTIHSAIVGGTSNLASGTRSVVIGGQSNSATTNHSAIVGGTSNLASGDFSFIGGGQFNTAATNSTTVVGGKANYAISSFSGVFAGSGNTTLNQFSTIIGGQSNYVTGERSVILGGQNITGTTDDTVYVPNLNIGTVGVGTSINNLGIDSSGNVVVGDSGTGGTSSSGVTMFNSGTTSAGGFIYCQLEIGVWDMDANISKNVPLSALFSVNEVSSFRNIVVLIKDNSDTVNALLEGVNGNFTYSRAGGFNLIRTAAGYFDNTSWNSTGVNRGYISFFYLPD